MILHHQTTNALRKGSQARTAFTLMEVLVVVAIIVILAGVGGVTYMNYLEGAKKDVALMGIKTLEKAAGAYKTRHGDFPPDLSVFVQPQEGEPAALEQKDLLDPWGRPYVYEPQNQGPTGKPHIYSHGPSLNNQGSRIDNFTR